MKTPEMIATQEARRKKEEKEIDKALVLAAQKLPWPTRDDRGWTEALEGGRFDDPGMVVRFKGES